MKLKLRMIFKGGYTELQEISSVQEILCMEADLSC